LLSQRGEAGDFFGDGSSISGSTAVAGDYLHPGGGRVYVFSVP
jgi:hypothetical protein